MRYFLRALTALMFLCLAAPAQAGLFGPPTLEPYKGPDAGRVVLTLGATYGTSFVGYKMFIRPVGKEDRAELDYMRGGFQVMKSDYSTDIDMGMIQVLALAPGDYEIYSLELDWSNGSMNDVFTPKQAFSIPFTVKAGETVYLGKYRVEEIWGKNWIGLPMVVGGVFYVSDQRPHDVPIAKRKDPAVGDDARLVLPGPDVMAVPIFAPDRGKIEHLPDGR